MKIIKIVLLYIISLCIISCSSVYSQDTSSYEKIIVMLNLFYDNYITERSRMPEDVNKVKLIKNEYCTIRLLSRLDSLSKRGLNFDPFINAQDWDISILKQLTIRKDTMSDFFEISYPNNYRKNRTIIKLKIIKQDNKYKIDDFID